MTNEDILADIRNKLGPAANLIALVDRYMNEHLSLDQLGVLNAMIKKEIPKAQSSINYVRDFELAKKNRVR